MNLARGSDLAGLSSLREQRELEENIQLIRPILEFSRNETEQICMELQLPIWIDPSNSNLNLKRNKVRLKIMPILEELHKGCTIRMAALAERLTHYQEDQKTIASLALESLQYNDGLNIKKLIDISPRARTILIAKWLEGHKIPSLSSKTIEEISNAVTNRKLPCQKNLPGGWIVFWSKDSINLVKPKEEMIFD